jgi:hypothetical protein
VRRSTLDISEVVGSLVALAATAGLGFELYGHGHEGCGTAPIEKARIIIIAIVGGIGLYFLQPRRTRDLVGLVGAYLPIPGGRRPADPPVTAPVVAPTVVEPPAPTSTNQPGGA